MANENQQRGQRKFGEKSTREIDSLTAENLWFHESLAGRFLEIIPIALARLAGLLIIWLSLQTGLQAPWLAVRIFSGWLFSIWRGFAVSIGSPIVFADTGTASVASRVRQIPS